MQKRMFYQGLIVSQAIFHRVMDRNRIQFAPIIENLFFTTATTGPKHILFCSKLKHRRVSYRHLTPQLRTWSALGLEFVNNSRFNFRCIVAQFIQKLHRNYTLCSTHYHESQILFYSISLIFHFNSRISARNWSHPPSLLIFSTYVELVRVLRVIIGLGSCRSESFGLSFTGVLSSDDIFTRNW